MALMTQITPFINCRDLTAQRRFFEDVLGFTCGFQADNYAFMRRDAVAVRLLQVDFDLDDPAREQMVYIDVDDVDALWDELAPALSKLPEKRVRAPFNQTYDQREFHVIDEGACLLFFGMAHPYPGNE